MKRNKTAGLNFMQSPEFAHKLFGVVSDRITKALLSFILVILVLRTDIVSQNLKVFENSENKDRVLYLAFLLIISASMFLRPKTDISRMHQSSTKYLQFERISLYLILTLLICSGIWTDPEIGFTPKNLLFFPVLICFFMISQVTKYQHLSRRYINIIFTLIFTCFYLLPLIQTTKSVIEPIHASRIINEIAGPMAGALPIRDTATQYGGFLGFPLLALKPFFSQDATVLLLPYLTILSIVTILIIGVISKMIFANNVSSLALFITIPTILMKPTPDGTVYPAGVQAFYQLIPERTLLPFLTILCFVYLNKKNEVWLAWCLGITLAFASLNNPESGLPMLIAILTCAVVMKHFRMIKIWLLSFLLTLVGVLVFFHLTSRNFDWTFWFKYSFAFGTGFLDLDMPNFGNYFLIFSVLLMGAISSFHILRSQILDYQLPASIALIISLWGLGTLPYYIARSSSWGQLQFFLISSSLVSVWLVYIAISYVKVNLNKGNSQLIFILLIFPGLLFGSAIIKAPNPQFELTRLSGTLGEATNWYKQWNIDQNELNEMKDKLNNLPKPVYIVSQGSNVIALKLQIESLGASGFFYDLPTEKLSEMQCKKLAAVPVGSVLFSKEVDSIVKCNADSLEDFTKSFFVMTKK